VTHPPPSHSTHLDLRPLAESDLPLLVRWLNTGTVLEWYGLKVRDESVIAEEYLESIRGEEPTLGYIAMLDGVPVGYGQWYRLADHPDYARQVSAEPHQAGIDLFISDAYQGRRLGVALIAALIDEIRRCDPTITSVSAGPDPRNERSLATFAKAGFIYQRTVSIEGEPSPEAIMRRDIDPSPPGR